MGRRRAAALFLAAALPAISSCGGPGDDGPRYAFLAEEAAHDAEYAETPIDAVGAVVDPSGAPLEGVRVEVVGWGEASAGAVATTDGAGGYVLRGLARRSALLRFSLDGHYDELVPVDLQRPIVEPEADAGRTVLSPKAPGRIRFTVGGDTMFGRRLVDRDEDGVTDEPEDLIRTASRAEDAKRLLRFLRDVLSSGDYTMANLETPVTDFPRTIHPYKEFKFHSHPDTLEALAYAGIDGVSLGNNHVYDLLEIGMEETLRHVAAAGVDWFGAGMDESGAKASVLRRTVGGVDFAMQGFNGIVPINFPPWGPDPWPVSLLYVARDGEDEKGGSLEMTWDNIREFIDLEKAARLAVPVIHGGWEYGEYPSPNVRTMVRRSLEEGAGFVVAHHPHTLYGIARLEAAASPSVAFLSMGNLLFDQDVFETFQSFLAVVDVEQTGPGAWRLVRVAGIPFHIEGYVPKLVVGRWADRIARHLGHLSTHLPPEPEAGKDPDGLVGAVVFASGNRVFVSFDGKGYDTSERIEGREVTVSGGASAPLPFVPDGGADFLARVRTDRPARCSWGRELLRYGDFEDLDVDDEFHEGQLWNQSGERFVENSVVRSGLGAMVLLRRDESSSSVTTWAKNRVTIPRDAKLTLLGHLKGQNSGKVEISVRWYVRDERDEISTTIELERAPGTWDWEPFAIDLDPPAEAGTVRFFLRQYPPASGEGRLFADDFALVVWEGEAEASGAGAVLRTPNDWSWLRFRPDDGAPTPLRATLTHRMYETTP